MSEIFRLIPFSWTIATSACVYGVALPIYTINTTSNAAQIALAVWLGVVGALVLVATGYYLLKIVTGSSNIQKDTTLEEILDLFDVWFALLTVQAAVCFVPYMFDRVNAYTGISSTESPWYAYAQFFLLVCNNFHGASGTNVVANDTFAILWLSLSSIVARMFLLIATWFVLRIVFSQLEDKRKHNRRRRKESTTGFTDVLTDYVKRDNRTTPVEKPSPFSMPARILKYN